MIKVFNREEFIEEVAIMESQYLEQFGIIPVDECDYDDLKIWFEDYKYECLASNSGAAFVDYGYIPF